MVRTVFQSEKVKISLLLAITAIIVAFFIKTDKKYTVIDVKKTTPVLQSSGNSIYSDFYKNIDNFSQSLSEDNDEAQVAPVALSNYKNSALALYFNYPDGFLALEDDKSSDISLLIEIYEPITETSVMKIYKDLFWYDLPRLNKDVFNEVAILYPDLNFAKEQSIDSKDLYMATSDDDGEHVIVIVANASLTEHSAVYYSLENSDEDTVWSIINSITFEQPILNNEQEQN